MNEPSTLRSEPYRLFFPLGILLAWLGVGPWLLFGLGLVEEYRSIFHSMVQVQGFLTCFAVGFLFTMLPRRTASPAAGSITILLCALGPLGLTVAAWLERWALAQACWLVVALLVLVFSWRRLRSPTASRRPPHAFVWIPAALLFGLVGTVTTGVGAALGPDYWALHEVGRGLVLQGMFLALTLGVGSFAIPLMTRGEAAPDAGDSAADRYRIGLHLVAVALLAASFPLEELAPPPLAFALRAGVAWSVLLVAARLHRPPTRPGWNRWAIWIAACCLPLGYTLAAIVPLLGKGALHVTFIGGFGLLALSVSSQVVLGHGGYERLKSGRPWPVAALLIVLAATVASRLLVETRPESVSFWLASAAGLFLLAISLWSILILPRLIREPRAEERSALPRD